MPHSRCAVHHMLVRLLPLRLTQAFHLEHLHRSESQLFGIELQLRSHLHGQRRGASAAMAAASQQLDAQRAGRFLGRRAGRNCQARPLGAARAKPAQCLTGHVETCGRTTHRSWQPSC